MLLDSKESKSKWSVFRESRGIYAFEFFEVASHALVNLMKWPWGKVHVFKVTREADKCGGQLFTSCCVLEEGVACVQTVWRNPVPPHPQAA